MPRIISTARRVYLLDLAGRVFSRSFDWAWGLMFLLLPITTLPLLSKPLGGVAVAPASMLPLVWLVVWFALSMRKKNELPFENLPFLAFVTAVLLSSLLAFFSEQPTFKSHSLVKTEAEGLLTLAIGAAFYYVTMAWVSTRPRQMEITLRLINFSGLVILVWSGVQAVIVLFFDSRYPEIMVEMQALFNTRGLFFGRITGFSFEPSWLAHQINLLFLPLWLASTLKKVSVHKGRIWKFTFENVLLAGGCSIVFLSSRVGTLAVLLVVAFLAVRLHLRLLHWLGAAIRRWLKFKSVRLHFMIRMLLSTLLISTLMLVYLLALIGLLYVLANVDARFTRLFDLEAIRNNLSNPYQLFNQLAFAERYVYWVTGWRIFNQYPLLGVGLGNAGLYFQEYLPTYSWVLPEVLENVYRLPGVMNIKAFWVRLLAETGILGLATFISWFASLWRTSCFLEADLQPLMKMIGLAGQIVLVAFLIEGFSLDTFALPYLWITLGLVSSAGLLVRKSPESIHYKL